MPMRVLPPTHRTSRPAALHARARALAVPRRPSLPVVASLVAYLPASSLPAIADEIGAGAGASRDPGLLVVPFCAAFALGFPAWGALADRRDRHAVMAAALLLLALAGTVVAAAGSELALVVGRALQGAAAAGVPPAAQALLAARAGAGGTGRAVSGMMVAVALATLGGPLLAVLAVPVAGWRGAVVVLCVVVPLVTAAVLARRARVGGPAEDARARAGQRGGFGQAQAPGDRAAPAKGADAATGTPSAGAPSPGARGSDAVRLRPTHGLVAGWLVSALVLGGYWTVLTRLATILGDGELTAPPWLAAAASLAGAAGIPLVLAAGRAADGRGPRAPMLATLLGGALAFGAAAAAPSALAFVAAVAVALALYWAYLPVVAVQVQRSAGEALRGRAAGVLYATMWLGAALAGTGAALMPGWRTVVAGAAVLWAAAAAMTWLGFLASPAPGARAAGAAPRGHAPRAPALAPSR